METTRRWQVVLVCVVLMALLAPAALAVDFIGGGPYTVDYPIVDYWNVIDGATVDFIDGSSLAYGFLQILDNTVVNFYDCAFAAGATVMVTGNSDPGDVDPIVTFYGTEFKVNGVAVDPSETQLILPDDTLSGLNESGEPFSVIVQCLVDGSQRWKINLAWLGGPSVIDVIVDIKPDSADNTINLGSLGVVPVGILSTADFDATEVDPWTVELAGAGVAVRGKGSKLLSSTKDLNGDGLLDLEVKVETENMDPGTFQDGAAILTGQTYDGLEILGSDSITIVPEL